MASMDSQNKLIKFFVFCKKKSYKNIYVLYIYMYIWIYTTSMSQVHTVDLPDTLENTIQKLVQVRYGML